MTDGDDDAKRTRAEYRARGWDGRCRLWATNKCSGGTKCKGGGDFRSPVTAPSPKMRPQGWRLEDRQIDTCPERLPGRVWADLRRFMDHRTFQSLPEPGTAGQQCSRQLQAIEILAGEASLIELAQQEERIEAAKTDG